MKFYYRYYITYIDNETTIDLDKNNTDLRTKYFYSIFDILLIVTWRYITNTIITTKAVTTTVFQADITTRA